MQQTDILEEHMWPIKEKILWDISEFSRIGQF